MNNKILLLGAALIVLSAFVVGHSVSSKTSKSMKAGESALDEMREHHKLMHGTDDFEEHMKAMHGSSWESETEGMQEMHELCEGMHETMHSGNGSGFRGMMQGMMH